MSFVAPNLIDQAGAYSIQASDLGSGDFIRTGLTAATTDQFPGAANMAAYYPTLGTESASWAFSVANPTPYPLTLEGDSATTFVGTNVIAAGTKRLFYASGPATAMVVQSYYETAIAP
ncbi:hypothetical protein [Paraburkholderia sp. Ac-20347]|uniref:hypothetical protein n=1 Tax=Paraburkholderia sp. Ac-20347 TaxID=2703892 RepID=UPI00197F3A47|nr:hypothetical protein [Paraburkholderia sp. Ac-20347]MBN3809421.1 hypothetical protein [Paraburkholderia sp. Ac-20347]